MNVGPDLEADKIVAAIHAAFPTDRSPALIAALAERGGHPETDEMRDRVAGREWNAVEDSAYLASCPSPFVMGESCTIYYLPGLLCAALRELEGDLADRLVTDFLRPPGNRQDFETFRRRFSMLTDAQKRSTANFLRYCRDMRYSNPRLKARIDDSISRFWGV